MHDCVPWELTFIFFFLFSAPNTGLYFRFQQIWAMFVKKFYISLRAYGFLISQLFFPVFFVIFANVLARSIPNNTGPEPKRALTLDNSALFVDNLTLFYAQFGNISIDNTSEPFVLSVSQYGCGITPFYALLLSGIDIIRVWCEKCVQFYWSCATYQRWSGRSEFHCEWLLQLSFPDPWSVLCFQIRCK